ncbi:MAG: hypothetical protein ABEJ86_07820 [Halococcoides sp.]
MNRRLRMGLVAIAVVLIAIGASTGFGIVAAEETPTLVDYTSEATVQPGETVNVSVSYENAAGIRLKQVPASWTVADSSAEMFDRTDSDGRSVGWVWMQNKTGTQYVVFEVPENASGSTDLPLVLERYKAGDVTGTVSVTVEGTATAPSVSVSGGTVAAGEDVTVEVTADDVGTLSLAGIPTSWGVDANSTAGASPLVGMKNGAQKVAWTWHTDQNDVTATVTLSIPETATVGTTTLTAQAGNSADETTTASGTVTVTEPAKPTLRVETTKTADGYNATVVLSEAPNGLVGYTIELATNDTGIARFSAVNDAVAWPGPFTKLHSANRSDDGSSILLKGTDVGHEINESSGSVELATVHIDQIGAGMAEIAVTDQSWVQDDDGNTTHPTPGSAVVGNERPPAPTVNVVGGSAEPGENVTVEVLADEVGTLSLGGIPTSWGVDASEVAGASPLVGTTNGARKVGWVWSENQQHVTARVTLSIPEDAAAGTTMLTAEAGNLADLTTTASGTVTVAESETPRVRVETSGDQATIVLSNAPTGLSGYALNLTSSDGSVVQIAGGRASPVTWPSTFSDVNYYERSADGSSIFLKASDANDQIANGSTGVELATVDLETGAAGTAILSVNVTKLQAENGDQVPHVEQSATITVTNGTTPSVSLTNASVTPGENATVTISAEDTAVLSLAGIPSEWTIADYDAAGGTPVEGTANDSKKIGWAYNENRDVTINVTLSVPASATADATLTAEAFSRSDRQATDTAVVTVTVPTPTKTESDGQVSIGGGGFEFGGETTTVDDGPVRTPVDTETPTPEATETETPTPEPTETVTDTPTTTTPGGGAPPNDGGLPILPILIVVVIVGAAGVLIYRR